MDDTPQATAQAERGNEPEAVGLRGNPTDLRAERGQMAGYGHGCYWVGYANGTSSSSRDEVLRFLGEPLPKRLSTSTIAGRQGPQAASLAGRRLARNQTLTAAPRI